MNSIAEAEPTASTGLFDRIRSQDSILALTILVVLPNLLFVLVSPWMILRRVAGPFLYLVAGILAILLPRPFAFPLFLAAAAIDGFLIVSLAFGMPFETAFEAMEFMNELDVAASLLYVGGTAYLLLVALGCAFLVTRYRERMRRASFLPVAVGALALMLLDGAINAYKPGMPANFQSAAQQASMNSATIICNNRNILIVLVEGMGAYANPAERDLLERKLREAAGTRFDLSHGTAPHYGSTTGATSRELCGKWGTYLDYMDGKPHDCLPSQLARSGFETIQFHGFGGNLFARRDWYPRIGIQKLNFREELERDHPALATRLCGSAMRGLCDDDVGDLVQAELAAHSERRKMVYWLTLNSHIPYAPVKNGPLHCSEDRPAIDSRMVCELTEIWMSVFDTVARIAADRNTPPLDILVVGDHNTPMWSRSVASHFVPGMVDWYHLKYNGADNQTVQMTR